MLKTKLMVVIGAFAGVVSQLMGGFTTDLKTLIILMSADFITGIVIAAVFGRSGKSSSGRLESKAGFKGLSRKCMILIFVLLAHRLDIAAGTTCIRSAVIAAYILNETVSLIENAAVMGLPIPQVLKRAVGALKAQNELETDSGETADLTEGKEQSENDS